MADLRRRELSLASNSLTKNFTLTAAKTPFYVIAIIIIRSFMLRSLTFPLLARLLIVLWSDAEKSVFVIPKLGTCFNGSPPHSLFRGKDENS
ncbi:TPA: hypothetical protein SML50_005170 [Serratia fonticola]|nr:hypothetical protein [Serratia fonticola]